MHDSVWMLCNEIAQKCRAYRSLQCLGRLQVSELTCGGSETTMLECSMSAGDDVFCAPQESLLLTCAGHGNPVGPPTNL